MRHHVSLLPGLHSSQDGSVSLLAGGSGAGGFHAGYDPHDYQVDTQGKVHSKMLNVVWMLTDNGPGDGEMVVIPGSHKA